MVKDLSKLMKEGINGHKIIKIVPALVNRAMKSEIKNKGGIDLTPANMNLQSKVIDSRLPRLGDGFRGNDIEGIKIHLDPAMLQRLQNAPGFVPVIINIQPMTGH